MTAARPWVTVVTGLPRSGTSMMMQVVAAGGVPVLTDGVRAADEDNPRGYFELEAVKRLRAGPPPPVEGWLGRAVKVVIPLLYELPVGPPYRVVAMHRAVGEVLASQSVMLARRGRDGMQASAGDDAALAAVFEAEWRRAEAWLRSRPDAEFATLDYDRVVQNPQSAAVVVDDLLGGSLDVAAMAAAVDPDLYRCRMSPAAQR